MRPGGRLVAAGAKLARGLRGALLNPLTLAVSLPAITNPFGLDRPWSRLEERLSPLQSEDYLWGTAYLAWAIKPPDAKCETHGVFRAAIAERSGSRQCARNRIDRLGLGVFGMRFGIGALVARDRWRCTLSVLTFRRAVSSGICRT
jgi:hypothetical protein